MIREDQAPGVDRGRVRAPRQRDHIAGSRLSISGNRASAARRDLNGHTTDTKFIRDRLIKSFGIFYFDSIFYPLGQTLTASVPAPCV